MRCTFVIAVVVALAACAQRQTVRVPVALPERAGTPVGTSIGKTWDAVIEQFAADNLPINVTERSSGLIQAAGPFRVAGTEEMAMSYATTTKPPFSDCGGVEFAAALGKPAETRYYWADRVSYNVLVRGDSLSALVRATATWTNSALPIRCHSTGVWEAAFEAAVKARAEAKR